MKSIWISCHTVNPFLHMKSNSWFHWLILIGHLAAIPHVNIKCKTTCTIMHFVYSTADSVMENYWKASLLPLMANLMPLLKAKKVLILQIIRISQITLPQILNIGLKYCFSLCVFRHHIPPHHGVILCIPFRSYLRKYPLGFPRLLYTNMINVKIPLIQSWSIPVLHLTICIDYTT